MWFCLDSPQRIKDSDKKMGRRRGANKYNNLGFIFYKNKIITSIFKVYHIYDT